MNIPSALRLAIAPALCAAVLASGCGDNDNDNEPTATATMSTAGNVAAFCEAGLALATLPPPEGDFETATEEEIAEAIKAHATEAMLPLVADLRASSPGDLADEVETLAAYASEAGATGVFEETAEMTAAFAAFEAFGISDCGWHEQAVSTVEYAFDGLQATLEAGPTLFRLANEGQEIHAMTIARKNDGVTLTTEEILELPDEEVFQYVSIVGDFGVLPGESVSEIVDLTPGDYIFVCLVPVGLTGPDVAPAPGAPPHATEGMLAEVTVA